MAIHGKVNKAPQTTKPWNVHLGFTKLGSAFSHKAILRIENLPSKFT